MVRGFARDRMPWVFSDRNEMLVGAFLGEYSDLFDAPDIADLCARLQRRLDRALCQRADRPTLEIGVADPR